MLQAQILLGESPTDKRGKRVNLNLKSYNFLVNHELFSFWVATLIPNIYKYEY